MICMSRAEELRGLIKSILPQLTPSTLDILYGIIGIGICKGY